MTRYQFGSCDYGTSQRMHRACAQQFLCGSGKINRSDMLGALAASTDAALAKECWDGWDLGNERLHEDDKPGDDVWDLDELTEAFADVRKAFDHYFPPPAIYTIDELYVVRSDEGDGGWSIHANGTEDEDGLAPVITCGGADMIDGEWSRPTKADLADALARINAGNLQKLGEDVS